MAIVRWKTSLSIVFHICFLLIRSTLGRNHAVNLEDEERRTFELSKFGFLQGGFLKVNFSDMTFTDDGESGNIQEEDLEIDNFGFSLEKTTSDGISPYMEQHAEKCILRDQSFKKQISVALVKFNLNKKKIIVEKYGEDFINLAVIESKVISTTMTATRKTTVTTEPTTRTNRTTKLATSTLTTVAKPTTGTATNTTTKAVISTLTSITEPTTDTAANTTTKAATSTLTTITEPTTGTVTNITKMASSLKSPPTRGNHSTAEGKSENNSTTATLGKPAKPGKNHTTARNISGHPADTTSSSNLRQRRGAVPGSLTPATGTPIELPLIVTMSNDSVPVYSGNFVVKVKTKAEEGLYNLYFHNCANYKKGRKAKVQVNIKVQIMEKNKDNYLSAGEEPLPYMFGVLSVMFFGTAVYWFHVLRQNRQYTYKVHYMMFVLILLKALDLAFQAINNHFISTDGKPAESWAVLYYITHLLKGALLFTTIVLIGTGYFFIKHVLSDRDKKIFIIVIPLQILANTAQIVMESTEEAKLHYTTWKEVFILVDLLCCGAILFPVVWSIRHLQEASETDGKAALNLAKLKLFRHFYVMIVCYIYFTRIIVYLIKITVPFQYMWLDDFFNNVASYVFFVLTGYKFRPAPDNPYLHVPQEESDEEVQMEEVVTTAGLAKGVTRLQASSEGRKIFETA